MSLSSGLRAALPGQRHRRRIYLHIGAMKTGTTYLQRLMWENRAELRRSGFLWPGGRFRDHGLAARDILGATDRRSPETEGKWREITQQMMAHDGRASIYSMEFLSYANEEQARAIMSSFPDREIHVILTVRDAREAVPAQWQTNCRMNGTLPLSKVIAAMARPADAHLGRAGRLLQRTQSVPRMLDTWGPLVPPGRLHVITMPPRGSEATELWRRFASVVGVRPGLCALPTGLVHRSLGYPSTELLRLCNVELSRRGTATQVHPVKKAMIVALGERVSQESPIPLNRRGARLASRWNSRARAAIERHGAHLVGSLEDLTVGRPDPSLPTALPTPSEADLLDAGHAAFVALVGHRARLAAGLGLDQPDEHDVEVADQPVTLDAVVAGLSDLLEECASLRVSAATSPTLAPQRDDPSQPAPISG